MNLPSQIQTHKTISRSWLALAGVLLLPLLISGCARPGEEKIHNLLKESYTCKNTEIVEVARTDSLPGIYSYVAQYTFHFRFTEGEEGAKKFFKGLLAEMDLKNKNWEEELRSEKAQAYLADECNEAAQMVLERMADRVIPKVLAGEKAVPLPYIMPVVGWSEFMPGRRGWDITMHRDHVEGTPMFTAPVERTWLLGKSADKPAKQSKKAGNAAKIDKVPKK